MKYNEFEKNLSQKLDAEEINVDTNALIASIHKGAKDKSYNYYFGFFGLLAIGLIVAWAINFNVENKNTVKNILQSNNLNSKKNSNDKNKVLNNSTSLALVDGNETKQVEENQQLINNRNAQEKTLNSNKSFINQANQKLPKIINNNTKNKNIPNTIHTNSSVYFNNRSKEKLINKNAEINTIPIINTPSSETPKLSDHSNKLKTTSTLTRSLVNVSILKKHDHELRDERDLEYEAVECPDFLTGGVKVSYNIEAGIFFADKALIEKEEENEDMFLLRKEKEKTLESLNIATSAIIKKENGPFYITAGLSYTRIAEQMKLDHNWTEYDTTVGIISTTTSQTGDTITVVMGDIIKEINYQRNSIDHYYIHLVDLPFGLGLENHRGNFIYGIDGGIQLNLYTNSSGRFYRNVTSFTELPNENVFRTAIGISYYGSMRMGLKLNYNSSVYLAGKVRFIPGDFAANNNNISQYYTLYGINAGYRYSF